MFLQNWLRKRRQRKQPKIEWLVPFVNFRYRDEKRNLDVHLNLALIGIDDAKGDILEETLMRLAQGFVNAIKQELGDGKQ